MTGAVGTQHISKQFDNELENIRERVFWPWAAWLNNNWSMHSRP